MLNIERSTYSYYETGKTVPDLKTIMKLSEIFREPLINLLEKDDNPNTLSDSALKDLSEGFFKLEKNQFIQEELCNVSKNKLDSVVETIQGTTESYPKFSSDLSDEEREVVMCFRMLSLDAQNKIKAIIEEKIKNEKNKD